MSRAHDRLDAIAYRALEAQLAAKDAELEQLRMAVGLLSTLKGDMEMRPDDPLGMAQEVEAYVNQLLAASRKREAAVAAALAECPMPSMIDIPHPATNQKPITVTWMAPRFFDWLDARKGDIGAAGVILARVREEARREGAIVALTHLERVALLNGEMDGNRTVTEGDIHERLAALKGGA